MSRARSSHLALTVAVALGAFVSIQPTATGAPRDAAVSAERTAAVATLTMRDFRVAVVARRLDGGGTPTAAVRVGLALRVGGSWRELRDRRLAETFFWYTVTGPRAVCRLEIALAGSSPSFQPFVTVQLLVSPSLGCGRTYRLPLPSR